MGPARCSRTSIAASAPRQYASDMDIWRVGLRYLVDEGDGGFALVDRAGAVVKRYATRVYSDEDRLWTWDHAISSTRFVERTKCARGSQAPEIEAKTLLRWLVPARAPATRAHVAAALAADRAARDAREVNVVGDGVTRLAAIPGALTEHALGVHLSNAQRALQERVRRWDCPVAAELLRLLGEFAQARPPMAAVEAFANGCLHASFDPGARTYAVLDGSLAVGGPPSPLAARISDCAASLDVRADGQEWADACRNAEAYRRAAAALRYAARALG
jgi:hypothetical protein